MECNIIATLKIYKYLNSIITIYIVFYIITVYNYLKGEIFSLSCINYWYKPCMVAFEISFSETRIILCIQKWLLMKYLEIFYYYVDIYNLLWNYILLFFYDNVLHCFSLFVNIIYNYLKRDFSLSL